jgi:cytoskeletal protein CcmA (bactofilin family)
MGTEMTVTDWPTAAPGSAARSRLAEDLEIDGDVSSAGPVDILGRIVGTVRAPDVLISASGRVAGQVMALHLSVLGTIDGTVAAKSVSLAGSSRVQADITHETITIETGAQFEGSLKRKS